MSKTTSLSTGVTHGFQVIKDRGWGIVLVWGLISVIVSLLQYVRIFFRGDEASEKIYVSIAAAYNNNSILELVKSEEFLRLIESYQTGFYYFIFIIISLFVSSFLSVDITRASLSSNQLKYDGKFFALGLKVLGMSIVLTLMILAFVALVVMAVMISSALLGVIGLDPSIGTAIGFALGACFCIAGFLGCVRLFVAIPALVDTGKFDPMAGWELTRGRSWSLLFANLLLALLLFAILGCIIIGIFILVIIVSVVFALILGSGIKNFTDIPIFALVFGGILYLGLCSFISGLISVLIQGGAAKFYQILRDEHLSKTKPSLNSFEI